MEVKQSLVMREEEHRQAIDSLKRFKISVSDNGFTFRALFVDGSFLFIRMKESRRKSEV